MMSTHQHDLHHYVELLINGEEVDLQSLMQAASKKRDEYYADSITYSKKVFIPLTHLCRDVCHYCTFAKSPSAISPSGTDNLYIGLDRILETVEQAKLMGCKEVLFTLGDKPELRYTEARQALDELNHASTLSYLHEVAGKVLKQSGLLPHLNPGVLTKDDLNLLRPVAPSMGLMLESSAEHLFMPGGPHYGSPDKDPKLRLQSIADAGELKVPLTTGILIGIGESRNDRIQSLLDLFSLHERYDHLQEIIIQNFIPKQGTKMHNSTAPVNEELLWTIAIARLIFPEDVSIQSPPNLNSEYTQELIAAGINDWGGVSPLTPDYVNPESPWPSLETLAQQTESSGKTLEQRLTVYPKYISKHDVWLDKQVSPFVFELSDSKGLARGDNWRAGVTQEVPALPCLKTNGATTQENVFDEILQKATSGLDLNENEIIKLFSTNAANLSKVLDAADTLRSEVNGDTVTYVVNRNINYTNICYYKCTFCAFSKGKSHEQLRGKPYLLDLDEIKRRSQEAWDRGATEVCLQGGIHPGFTGETYINICHAIKDVVPDMHIHAFSPLEITQGAQTSGISITELLIELQRAGLKSLPGTAAEILDDEVRKTLCPDKINSEQWLNVIEAAHDIGLRTTATIMYGHMEPVSAWARHLLKIRTLQKSTGGFTEFVPLPFVANEAPLYKKGKARPGPTYMEAVLMHAVARLVLHPHISNIQTSWVKMGAAGVKDCLQSGVNDLGGTLMNESISKAAGGNHGQEFTPEKMDELILGLDRIPIQRTSLYQKVNRNQKNKSYQADEMKNVILNNEKFTDLITAGAKFG